MINPMELMKKIGDMQNIAKNMNLEELQIHAESGGGLVKVVVNGRLEMTALEIDPLAVDKRDVKMLQDLIISAQNEASRKMVEEIKTKIGNELGIPGFAGLNL